MNAPQTNPEIRHNINLALDLAERGWRVFPCSPVDKKPLTKHGFKDGTTNESEVRKMFAEHPKAMVGVACGAESGVWCLDPDAPTETNPIDA